MSKSKEKNEIEEIEIIKKEIEELKKEIKSREKQIEDLKVKINKYSRYKCSTIGNTIAKLVTIYEGEEYQCTIREKENQYIIIKKDKNTYEYPIYTIKTLANEEHMCCLSPSKYNILEKRRDNIESLIIEFLDNSPGYIQLFIDYLYKIRSSKEIDDFNQKELYQALKEFLSETKELQGRVRRAREEIKRKREIEKKRIRFINSCIIDRKIMYHIILYIIKYYEENIFGKEEFERQDKDSYFDWYNGYEKISESLYHNLIIEYNDKKIKYKAFVDSGKTYIEPDCYCSREVYLDVNKNTDINFFEIKRHLSSVIDNSTYLKIFFERLELAYKEQNPITADILEEILADISNMRKQNQKIRRLNVG